MSTAEAKELLEFVPLAASWGLCTDAKRLPSNEHTGFELRASCSLLQYTRLLMRNLVNLRDFGCIFSFDVNTQALQLPYMNVPDAGDVRLLQEYLSDGSTLELLRSLAARKERDASAFERSSIEHRFLVTAALSLLELFEGDAEEAREIWRDWTAERDQGKLPDGGASDGDE